ncbi:MAG: ABC transporter ATP-binding protein [Ruminococcaceae bacterium]|nr:ABC transporter ATP-binding protein [Oscillospiraceae bacterium]
MIKKLAKSIRGYWGATVATPLVMIGEVAMETTIPLVIAAIIDDGIKKGSIDTVWKYGILMVAMAIVSLIFGALGGWSASYASAGFAKNLRGRLFNKVQDFSFANIDRFSTPSLITRLTTDVNNVSQTFQMMIRMMIRSPMMFVIATIMAVNVNAKLATVFLIAIPLLVIGLLVIIKFAFPMFNKMLKKYDDMNASVQENLTAIRVVKAFVHEDHEIDKFVKTSEGVRKAMVKAEKIVAFNGPLMMLAINSCMIAILWFGGVQITEGIMTTGELVSFITYIMQILMSLMMLSMIVVMFSFARASATRICEVIDEQLDIADGTSDAVPQDGSIVFDDVCFSYAKKADNLTIEHLSCTIQSGETVGIIGGTGSAKTTFVQLIPRLYDVLSGSVTVGGHDVREYRIKTLRDNVAMVLQNNVLFSGTIRDNLRWGDKEATDKEIEAACRAAQAHDFITSFPDGYDTILGQGGVNVSGGQKQRLCIARALLKKPKIIILDDSTSAVDTATDANIREAFRRELTDTTTLIIAQRISSVSDADKIIVLDDGKINAIGTHEELLANNEIYREVYMSQQKGVE